MSVQPQRNSSVGPHGRKIVVDAIHVLMRACGKKREGKQQGKTVPCIRTSLTDHTLSPYSCCQKIVLPAKVIIQKQNLPTCSTELTITAIISINFSHRKHRLPLSYISNNATTKGQTAGVTLRRKFQHPNGYPKMSDKKKVVRQL